MLKKLPIHLPVFIGGSILIFICGLIGLLLVMYPMEVNSFFGRLTGSFQTVALVGSGSSVEIYREQNQLRLDFEIDEEDSEVFEQLSARLGISEEWKKGIGLTLDNESLDRLTSHLPLRAGIDVEDNKILITSLGLKSFLHSGVSGERITFATGSGQLDLSAGNEEYELKLKEPKELVRYATESGKMNLSNKVTSGLFSLMEKVDTIELSLKGKSLEGEIGLR